MPIDEFIIHAFCLVDDFIKEEISSTPLRKRGFSSNLTDSEVITMRLVGEYLGFGDEKPIWDCDTRLCRGVVPTLQRREPSVPPDDAKVLNQVVHNLLAELV
jgi:hypothetical protein